MSILYIKALHIIFVITWFAGLFYMVRLLIYHAEAEKKEEPAKEILQTQYKLMEWRLWYIITWPSSILAMAFGYWMMFKMSLWMQPWMLLKVGFVTGLFLYQIATHRIFIRFRNGDVNWGGAKLRIWNEVATLFLFAIVFLVVLKDGVSWIWGMVALVIIAAMMMLGIKIYKRLREKNGDDS